jgi:hypothetical protein
VLIEIIRKIIVRSEVLGCVITSISLTVARLKASTAVGGNLVAARKQHEWHGSDVISVLPELCRSGSNGAAGLQGHDFLSCPR